jgi:spore coat protein U-like protein
MKPHSFNFLLFMLAACTSPAWGQINCSLVVTNVAIIVNTAAANSDGSANITVNCDRPGNQQNSNPADETYTVGMGPGLANRQLTRAGTPATLLPYQVYQDPGYATPWTQSNPSAAFSTNFPPGNARTFSITLPYYFRVPTPANPTDGSYNDTVAVTLNSSPGGAQKTSSSLSPSATLAAACILSTPPASLTLNYTSFSASAITSNTAFAVKCTNTVPYTLAVSPTTGTLMALSYSLSLSTSTATGTGVAQTYTVNGTVAAGQSGTCAAASCNASAPHTVTITY